jgi:hypothetical protein
MTTLSRPRFLTLVAGWLLLLVACGRDTWMGTVYPDRSDLTRHEQIGWYESLPACRGAAQRRLHQLRAAESGDYECGLNCEPLQDSGDLWVCKETLH